MKLAERILAWSIAVTVIGLAVYGAFGLNRSAIRALDSIRDSAKAASPVLQSVNTTLGEINRPCKGESCGTLANVEKTTTRVRDITTVLQKQVAQSGELVDAATVNLNKVAGTADDELDALRRTTNAATGTLLITSQTIGTINHGIEPLLDAYTATGVDLDAILKDAAIHRTLTNVDSITESGAGIMADSRQVADKMTHDFLTPVPWYKQPSRWYRLGIDIGTLAK